MTNQIIEEIVKKFEELIRLKKFVKYANLSNPQIEEIESFMRFYIQKALAQQREGFVEKVKSRLDYCQKQNGLPYCKNCGLNKDDLKSLNN